MSNIKVKWGKQVLELSINLQSTLNDLKTQLQTLTSVPVERQKIMGLKLNVIKDNATLSELGLNEGKTIMLIGTVAEEVKELIPTSSVTTSVVQSTVDNSSLISIPNGLRNIANTCYMNSAIQMLRLLPEVREIIESCGNDSLLQTLGQLYKSMDNTKDSAVPLLFWNALIGQCPNFGELDDHGHPMQHDAQEALNAILQRIKDLSKISQKTLFTGSFKQTTICKEDPDDTPIIRDLPFLMLSCNINTEVQRLEAGLEAGFNETITLPSEKLAREAIYSRISRISTLPEYIFVHLVRFSWRSDIQTKAKILKPISFPIILDLFSYCTDELKSTLEPERVKVMQRRDKEIERRRETRQKTRFENTKEGEENTLPTANKDCNINLTGYYELCGVISHKGRGADSGHYVFWGKSEQQWMVFDDENVAPVTEEDVMRLRGVGEAHIAYVLLYRSRDPQTKQPIIPI